jgi:hypothetical protein
MRDGFMELKSVINNFKKIVFLAITALIIIFFLIFFYYKEKSEKNRNEMGISSINTDNINSNIIFNSKGVSRAFGLKIKTIDQSKIYATAFIDGIETNFLIETNVDTAFYRKNEPTKINKIIIGDILLVSGDLVSFSPQVTFKALEVRAFENFSSVSEQEPQTK